MIERTAQRQPAPLLPMVQLALPGAAGRIALHCRPAGRLAAPPPRMRFARALLQDAAETGGGALYALEGGEMLLLGASLGAGERAAAALDRLAGAESARLFTLPRDSRPLLDWAESARLAAPTPPAPEEAPPASLEGRLRALPPESVLRHRSLLRPGGGQVGRRVRLSAAALAPAGADPALRAHAAALLSATLLPGLAAWARELSGLRLLPLPPPPWPDLPAAGAPGLHGVLPLPALAAQGDAVALLAARGWGIAVLGPPAGNLPFLAEALPASLFLLRWSVGLGPPPVPPGRLLLTGCDSPAALAWARRHGVVACSGPAAEAAS